MSAADTARWLAEDVERMASARDAARALLGLEPAREVEA